MNIAWVSDNKEYQIIFAEKKSSYKVSSLNLDKKISAEYDCIIIYANLNRNERSERFGLKKIEALRRDDFTKSPMIIYSFESFQALKKEFPVIDTKGIYFLRLPFTEKEIKEQITKIQDTKLTEEELKEIVNKYCNLKQKWSGELHKIGGLLKDSSLIDNDLPFEQYKNRNEFLKEFKELSNSVRFYETKYNNLLTALDKILALKTSTVKSVKSKFEELGDSLKGKAIDENWRDEFERLPKSPPKGYSKVLIADDESLPFLVTTLQTEFYYEVEQSYYFTEAAGKLERNKPSVVLSDYYYKRTKFEKPRKEIGEAFMRKAQLFEIGTPEQSKKPIVAVISKVSLDPNTEIRAGIVDCSGLIRSTNPDFIHYKIWQKAIELGITEPESIGGTEISSEMRCRQRLEPIFKQLPRTIAEWKYFRETINETLKDLKSVICKKKSTDSQILTSLIKTLTTFSETKSFSLKQVEELYTKIEEDHDKARESESSEASTQIRDVLHGQIDQFYKIVNAIKTKQRIISEVSEILINSPGFTGVGSDLKQTVNNFDENKDILPYLSSLQNYLEKILQALPELPANPYIAETENGNSVKYTVISVEDQKIWQYAVEDAVEKLKKGLAGFAEINYQHFDNTSDAISKFEELFPSIKKGKSKSESKNDKTNSGSKDDPKSESKEKETAPKSKDKSEIIAILDMCLPEKTASNPQRKNGFGLLETLSSYTTNFPKFVFSTKTSINDIIELGKAGIPNRRFIAKDNNAVETIIARLAEVIQKKEKNFIRLKMDENGDENLEIYINGLKMRFPETLKATFYALIELTNDSGEETSSFTPIDIYQKRPKGFNNKQLIRFEEQSKKKVEDDFKRNNPGKDFDGNYPKFYFNEELSITKTINELREFILKSFQENNLHINPRNLLKTIVDSETGRNSYQLNADIESNNYEGIDDENDAEATEDEEEIKNSFEVLVVHNNTEIRERIVENLNKKPEVSRVESLSEYAEQIFQNFNPDIICVSLELIPSFSKIREILNKFKFGIIITVSGEEKNQKNLSQQIIEMEIPFTNFIELREKNWENTLLTKFDNEIRRVFFGELTEIAKPSSEPTVKILPESRLEEGVVRLNVNGKFFKMSSSNISKILGYLLMNPHRLISFKYLKNIILNDQSQVTKDNRTKWTERLRTQIQEKWLEDNNRQTAMKILTQSEDGLMLNVQVIKT